MGLSPADRAAALLEQADRLVDLSREASNACQYTLNRRHQALADFNDTGGLPSVRRLSQLEQAARASTRAALRWSAAYRWFLRAEALKTRIPAATPDALPALLAQLDELAAVVGQALGAAEPRSGP